MGSFLTTVIINTSRTISPQVRNFVLPGRTTAVFASPLNFAIANWHRFGILQVFAGQDLTSFAGRRYLCRPHSQGLI